MQIEQLVAAGFSQSNHFQMTNSFVLSKSGISKEMNGSL